VVRSVVQTQLQAPCTVPLQRSHKYEWFGADGRVEVRSFQTTDAKLSEWWKLRRIYKQNHTLLQLECINIVINMQMWYSNLLPSAPCLGKTDTWQVCTSQIQFLTSNSRTEFVVNNGDLELLQQTRGYRHNSKHAYGTLPHGLVVLDLH